MPDDDITSPDIIDADNAADAIIAKANEIIEQAVTTYEQSQGVADHNTRAMLNYLIRKQVWGQLNQQLGLGPDELREEADTLEEEAEDESEDE